jgi:hypothetical protein
MRIYKMSRSHEESQKMIGNTFLINGQVCKVYKLTPLDD